ncbi:MAG: HlyD family secretion protein [Ignavibacterium sp.]|nr:HlyD family secretion protein [Ignavibacterium sp.]
MDEKDNIELRSEKVRNLIGQIPPVIIRAGISVIFFIILVLLFGSWFFRFEYTIKTTATINQNTDSLFIELKIPANEISKIKTGQKVILNFNNIPNLYNEKIVTEIQTISHSLEITGDGGFFNVEILLPGKTKTESGRTLSIKKEIKVNAEIITDKISLFDRITEPIRTLFNKLE